MNPVIYNGKKIIKIEKTSPGLFLTWILNNICTYHCSYCPEIVHGGKNHHYDWAHVKPFLDQCFDRYPYVHCSLSGGEPTVSPFFKELVNEIHSKKGTIHVTTNLVRSWDYWESIADKFSSISVSYHSEFVVTEEEEDEFIDKLSKLSHKSYVTLRMMMHPRNWERCVRVYEKALMASEPFTIEVVRILPDFGTGKNYFDASYSDDQIKFLNDTPIIFGDPKIPNFVRSKMSSDIIYNDDDREFFSLTIQSDLEKNKSNNFFGWECAIGLESLFVHYDGGVQRANCEVGGVIGNIVTGFEWPTERIICNKNLCHCAADVVISKEFKNV